MKRHFISTLLPITLLLSGCGTMQLQTNVKMTKDIVLNHTNKQKTIFIEIQNLAGNNFNLLPLLKKDLEKKGYKIVDNKYMAKYVLTVKILFANNLKKALAIKAGATTGLAGGFIAKAGGHNTGDSILIGATIALATAAIGSALEDEIYRAVVEVNIDQKDKTCKHYSPIMGNCYEEQKTRVLAEAVKTNLKLNEALPILSKKVANKISTIF